MKIALAIIFPPLGVLACGKFGQFLLNIFFCIIGVWIGGIIHAVYVVMKHDQDERHREMILDLQASQPSYHPLMTNGERAEIPKKRSPSAALLGCGVLLLLIVLASVVSSLLNLANAGNDKVSKTQGGDLERAAEKPVKEKSPPNAGTVEVVKTQSGDVEKTSETPLNEKTENPAASLPIEEPKAPTVFESRLWTSADGQRTFVGKLTELGDGNVTVEKDGEPMTFPIAKLSEADRRFLGQGVTITTGNGVKHENGSVTQISEDSILFKTVFGVFSIPMESLPENLRQHFAYDPSKAAAARKARELQAAATQITKKTFPLAVDDLIASCNRIAASRNLDLNYQKHQAEPGSVSYFVNDPNRILITFMTSEGNRFHSCFLIGSGDGTILSGAKSLGSCICLFRALEPNLTQEEAASQIMKMVESAQSGKAGEFSGRNGTYSLSHSAEIGLLFAGDAN